ncbi:MAG: two-component system response regulator [Desulfobacterales bacterium RIFOXYA12_FULL_46_15]|nr:MAG: two-component system response regulator [Desulfobacterales bacterium RIFOXYA12_FULL_46_15]
MSYSILIVDDSLPMRSVIKKTIRAAGYGQSEFLEAANGKEALKLLKNNWVDMVLTDHNMPVMNGLDFIRAVKADAIIKTIPVVVISTEGNESRVREFMDSGAAGYLAKPFTAEAIRDLIVKFLGEASYDEDYSDSNENLDF